MGGCSQLASWATSSAACSAAAAQHRSPGPFAEWTRARNGSRCNNRTDKDVALAFDNNTKIVYQNRTYSVTSLESGDQLNARVQQLQDGSYYTDSVQVTQPVSGSGTRRALDRTTCNRCRDGASDRQNQRIVHG